MQYDHAITIIPLIFPQRLAVNCIPAVSVSCTFMSDQNYQIWTEHDIVPVIRITVELSAAVQEWLAWYKSKTIQLAVSSMSAIHVHADSELTQVVNNAFQLRAAQILFC